MEKLLFNLLDLYLAKLPKLRSQIQYLGLTHHKNKIREVLLSVIQGIRLPETHQMMSADLEINVIEKKLVDTNIQTKMMPKGQA